MSHAPHGRRGKLTTLVLSVNSDEGYVYFTVLHGCQNILLTAKAQNQNHILKLFNKLPNITQFIKGIHQACQMYSTIELILL